MKRAAILLSLVGLLGGCVKLSQPAPQIREYRLDYPPPAVTGAPLPTSLSVPRLGVAAAYDRDLIVYREGLYSTGTYFYDRWSANPGSMIADLLARDFANSGLYRAVQQKPSLLPSDYQLSGEVVTVEEQILDKGCAAHLDLRVMLLRVRNGAGDPVRLHKSYGEDEPCACNDGRALAAAMSGALHRISTQLEQDVYDAIAKDQR